MFRFPMSQHSRAKRQMRDNIKQNSAAPFAENRSAAETADSTGISASRAKAAEDMLWGFRLTPAPLLTGSSIGEASIASALSNMIYDPVECIKQQLQRLQIEEMNRHGKAQPINLPVFIAGMPIVITFQYGPFGDANTWFVHGVEHTNIISVRCPPLAGVELSKEKQSQGAAIEVHYLTHPNPVISFAHFDPREANVDWLYVGKLLAHPTRFATLLNAQTKIVKAGDMNDMSLMAADTSDNSSSDSATHFSDAVFTISDSFRFRYEFYPLYQENVPDDLPYELQCIKFAGTHSNGPYSAMTDGPTLVMQIDEAWSMRWQGNPPDNP